MQEKTRREMYTEELATFDVPLEFLNIAFMIQQFLENNIGEVCDRRIKKLCYIKSHLPQCRLLLLNLR